MLANFRFGLSVLSVTLVAFAANTEFALAQKKYDAGATDTEIKIGNINPYSGPASAYGSIGKTQAAFFKMINQGGGINGRKINFISYDDAYSPPKAVEQVRKLVEGDEVLLIFNSIGTPPNSAIQKYLNSRKVPQLFVASGASKFSDPKSFPWTMQWAPNIQTETRVFGKYILENYPNQTIGVLYQNDDFGKDFVSGLRGALGENAVKAIVIEVPYETSVPTVDSQVVRISFSKPDIFVNASSTKFAAQAIKKVAELGWKPVHIMANASASISGVMKPAGFQNSQGVLSVAYMKDSTDPQWKDDPAMKEWAAFMDKYYPEGNKADQSTLYGYGVAKGLVEVLKQCGDELTRENVMKQAANLNFEIGIYLPGMRIKTSPTDYQPLQQLQMMKFQGETWNLFGPLIDGSLDN